jgi:hypothetical protein
MQMKILPSISQITNEDIKTYGNANIDISLIGDFIDYGGQYKVFAYSTDKVIKVPLSKEEIFYRIANWGHETPDLEVKYQQLVSSRDKSVGMINSSRFSISLLGNFEVHNQVIVQDKVQVWCKIFDTLDKEIQKNYLLQVINLYIELWICGLHEHVYNFSLNCGIDGYGNVVLIDFGEITNEKSLALQDITKGKILKAWSAQSLPTDLQEFYAKHVSETLTLAYLDLYWKS